MTSESAEQIHNKLLNGDNSGARDLLVREFVRGDFYNVVGELETLTKASNAPDVYTERTQGGSITKVKIDDDPLFIDTSIFDLYGDQSRIESERTLFDHERLDGLPNAFQEQLARNFVNDLASVGRSGSALPEARKVVERFVEDVLTKVPQSERKDVFQRAQQLNDEIRGKDGTAHAVNFVFADLNNDGKRDELADANLVFEQFSIDRSVPRTVDVFEPDLPPGPAPRRLDPRLYGPVQAP